MASVTVTVTVKDATGALLASATVKARELDGTGALSGATGLAGEAYEAVMTTSGASPAAILVAVSKSGYYRSGCVLSADGTTAAVTLILQTNRG
jgi:hypothetical protein